MVVFGVILSQAAGAQGSREDDMRVTLALQKYQLATLRMDTPAVAALFTPDATIAHELQTPIAGRDSIRRFLESVFAMPSQPVRRGGGDVG